MAYKSYTDVPWIVVDVDINYERKPLNPSILNGYLDDWVDLIAAGDAGLIVELYDKGRKYITDETDPEIENFRKQYIDPYDLCRSIEIYNLKKDVNANEINDGRIDYFSVSTGLIPGVISDVKTTAQLAKPTKVLVDHVKMINHQNKTATINCQYTQFNAWAIKLTETIASP